MAHLPAGARLTLAVEMQLHVREPARGRPVRFTVDPQITEQIRHGRRLEKLSRSERQAADRTHLLLELTRDRGVEREMARVVRTRRELVDEQLVVCCDEEFHAQ